MKRSTALLKIIGLGSAIVVISGLLIFWVVGVFAKSVLWGFAFALAVLLMVGLSMRRRS